MEYQGVDTCHHLVQSGILNDEVRCVGDAEEELGWKKNNGPSILWFR